jgi:hypothetical protein
MACDERELKRDGLSATTSVIGGLEQFDRWFAVPPSV